MPHQMSGQRRRCVRLLGKCGVVPAAVYTVVGAHEQATVNDHGPDPGWGAVGFAVCAEWVNVKIVSGCDLRDCFCGPCSHGFHCVRYIRSLIDPLRDSHCGCVVSILGKHGHETRNQGILDESPPANHPRHGGGCRLPAQMIGECLVYGAKR